VLTEEEMTAIDPLTEQYYDMCFKCVGLGEEGEDEFDIPEYTEIELWEQ
jgi:hypothetical protein